MTRTSDDYLALITSWHRTRPKFVASVQAMVEPMADIVAAIEELPADFDLDTAVGVQLDIVGQWVGRSRFVRTPLTNIYFSFDIAGRGFDQGIWKGPYDSAFGTTRLDDETYRLLLRAKIAANNWDGTVSGAQKALDFIFGTIGAKVFIHDRYDMSAVFGVSQKLPDPLYLSILTGDLIPLKPVGVATYYRVVSVDMTAMFGFDVSNDYIAGFDQASWGVDPALLNA